jgi:hypothetical protein
MCRVLIATKRAIEEYDKMFDLEVLLIHLEKECGGQGNGVATFAKSGEIEFLEKGLNVTTKQCRDIMMNTSYEYAIFHTRIASVGKVTNERCHPFCQAERVDGRAVNVFTAGMNGTIYDLDRIADALGVTDTEVVMDILKDKSPEQKKAVLEDTKQVWVGMLANQPFAFKGYGALEEFLPKMKNTDTAFTNFFFASSFPLQEKKAFPKKFNQLNKEFYMWLRTRDEGIKPVQRKLGKTHWAETHWEEARWAETHRAEPIMSDEDYIETKMWKWSFDKNETEEAAQDTSIEGDAYDKAYEAGYEDGFREACLKEGFAKEIDR